MSTSTRPRIAAIVTTYFKYSHGQHIVDRFLDGYGWNGTHHYPPMDLVSLYVDQIGRTDLSRERGARHPAVRLSPAIADALTLGGSKLAVDGVVLVGEHGNYPRNDRGQTQYPRYEFFEQIVNVFRSSNRAVPVFNDKHLSWKWEWARKMYDTSRQLRFAFMAGSSLPLTWRTPSVEMPLGARISEALCIGYGLKGSTQIWSTQFLLTPEPNVTYSAWLMHKAREMFESGVAPYPIERTLLVSGILESCLTSKVQDSSRLETPLLSMAYQPPKESQFART